MLKIRRIASAIDRLPVAPATIAKALIGRHHRRRTRNAATDPQWAAIQARRSVDGRGSILFLSNDGDLQLHHWATQNRIEKELTPDPWWMPLARQALHWELHPVAGAVHKRRQRAARGWADADTWNLGHHLARTLGEMLTHLADNLNGWPGTDEFETPESWESALRDHGATLLSYANSDDRDGLLHAWSELADDPDAATEDVDAARTAMSDAEQAQYNNAQLSLHWVADHLGNLWD